jgi:hypothetical protein
LLNDRLGEFYRLQLVELALLEEDREVLEHGLRLAWDCRHLLEEGDGLRSAEETTGRICGDAGSSLNITGSEKRLELRSVQVIGAREVQA